MLSDCSDQGPATEVVIVVPYQVGLLELQWDVLMAVSCVVDLVFVTDAWPAWRRNPGFLDGFLSVI